jgi:hypothetical protein
MRNQPHRLSKLSLLSGVLFFSVVPGIRCQAPQGSKERAIAEDKINEAVLRAQMVSWYRSADEEDREAAKDRGANGPHDMNYRTFLISVNSQDPSEEFIRKFKNIPRTIKPASKGHYVKEPFPGWLRDTDTNDRVVQFYVGQIDWKSGSEVEVGGGYYCGGLCAAHYVFKLKKAANKWIVASSELKVIS